MKQPVRNVEEAKAILKEHKAEVVLKYRVRQLGIFGSFVRGEQNKRSDVDILVTFSGMPDVFKYMELEDYLRKLLRKRWTSCGWRQSARSSRSGYSRKLSTYDPRLYPLCKRYLGCDQVR